MQNVPRNVFRVCPEVQQPVEPVSRKYEVKKSSTGEVLRVCENQITIDDLKKAAKCAKFDFFRAYTVLDAMMEETDFPCKKNVNITKSYQGATGGRSKVFSVCETTTVVPTRSTPARRPPVRGFKIFRRSTGEVLRVCENQITIDDLKKAARCARYDGDFRAYNGRKGGTNNIMQESDFPAQKNVYITRARKDAVPSRTSGTRLFSVCESTSVPPRRTTPTPVSVPNSVPKAQKNTGRKKLLSTAISALKMATNALEELSRTL